MGETKELVDDGAAALAVLRESEAADKFIADQLNVVNDTYRKTTDQLRTLWLPLSTIWANESNH